MLCYVVIFEDAADVNFTQVMGAFKSLEQAKECLKSCYVDTLNEFDDEDITYCNCDENSAIITIGEIDKIFTIHKVDLY